MTKQIYIITGEVESGKTRWLQGAVDFLSAEGKVCAGVITPGIWQDGNKLGIDAVLLPSGEKLNLAMRNENNDGFSKKWKFNDEAMAKVNQHFASLDNFDFLIVDELGPLELERGEGLTNAVEILKSGNFKRALVIVRPHLIDAAMRLFANFDVELILPNKEQNYNKICLSQ